MTLDFLVSRVTEREPVISKLVFTILSAVAENERDRIRERVRDAKRHRASQRLYNGGKRPFGYDIVDGRLVPNTNEQAALKHGRGMQANGDSLRSIPRGTMDEVSSHVRLDLPFD